MPCNVEPLGPDSWAIICGPRKMPGRCAGCDASSTLLCDGPGRNNRKTCDAPICRSCAKAIGKNRDLCPGCVTITHAVVVPEHPRAAEWQATFGEHPVRLVWRTPKPAAHIFEVKPTGQQRLVWRLHLAQLEAERVVALAVHLAVKYGYQRGLLHQAFLQGRLHPTVDADLLRIWDGR